MLASIPVPRGFLDGRLTFDQQKESLLTASAATLSICMHLKSSFYMCMHHFYEKTVKGPPREQEAHYSTYEEENK
jgi:hypothetical protein